MAKDMKAIGKSKGRAVPNIIVTNMMLSMFEYLKWTWND
jgi:hypothetical protein